MKLTYTNKVLKKFETVLEKELQNQLQDKNSSGNLEKSVRIVSQYKNGRLSVYVEMEDYGTNVDEGRKPGSFVPIDDLKPWIKKKKSFKYKGEAGLNSLAYAVSKSISKKGIAPTNFIDKAIDKVYDMFVEDLVDAYGDDIIEDLITD